MRQFLSIFLALMILLTCAACQQESETPENSVTVYYRASAISYGTAEGVIRPCLLDTTNQENDAVHLLNAYFSRDLSEEFAATFPQSTRLVSLSLDGLTAKIILCDDFAMLSGLDLSIACACLTKTVISLTGCQEVIISTESAQLDGHNFITLTQDSYLLLDESGMD